MTNSNKKYRNGLIKRDAVRKVWADLVARGVLTPRTEQFAQQRLGYAPHFAIDTNIMFAVIEYWAADLRKALRALASAQPSLRLYLLDVVASECRGSLEKRALFDDIVFTPSRPEWGAIYPLSTQHRKVEDTLSSLQSQLPTNRPSDTKDYRIGAAAEAFNLSVITRNGSDFAKIAELLPNLHYEALPTTDAELRMGAEMLSFLGNIYTD
ncbi:MAG TPA: hypothetical protein VLO13_00280 [Halomonas sp.]|nr:hypothetical protein [Halomonas sp.]